MHVIQFTAILLLDLILEISLAIATSYRIVVKFGRGKFGKLIDQPIGY